jgi:hypothetical protein
MQYRRILTLFTAAFMFAGFALVVSTAKAGPAGSAASNLHKLGEWTAPTQAKASQPSIRVSLGEIGAWAVPARQTKTSQPRVDNQLGEIGSWAVPSSTPAAVTSTGDGFDWNGTGIGIASAVGLALMGIASVVTLRRHHRGPVAH